MATNNKDKKVQINNYIIDKQISQRLVSSLYLAHDTSLKLPVFIAILQKDFVKVSDFAAQFQQRNEKVTQIKHDNIAAIRETGITAQKQPFIVIEYISDTTMAEMVTALTETGVTLPTTEALLITRQLADALATAHAVGLIHYDLRPKNIYIRDERKPVLIDLGLPIALAPQLTEADEGTAAMIDYMSPEQADGQTLTNQSNIYSLGVILYELLADHRPYLQTSPNQQDANRFTQAAPLEDARPGLTTETYRLARNCLQREPGNRFGTLDEMVAAIDLAIAAEETAQQLAVVPSKRLLPSYILTGVVLLTIIIAGIFLTLGQDKPSPQIQTTPLEAGKIQTLQAKGAIEIVGPASGSEFTANDTVTFDWFWPTPLESGQQFAIHLLAGDDAFLLGTVTKPVVGSRYQLRLKGNEIANGPGEYNWQIILEQTTMNESLFVSDTQQIKMLAATPIPTFDPTIIPSAIVTSTTTITPTTTATATVTMTPSPTPGCVRTQPPGWEPYTIKLGDYLSPLAVGSGVTVERVMEVNCLDTVILSIDQVLYLPGRVATETPVPTAPSESPVSTEPSSGSNPSNPPKPTQSQPQNTRTPPPP